VIAPALSLYVGDEAVHRLSAPASFGERRWILGVAAIQVEAQGGAVRARLRAHVTGAAAPFVRELASPAIVHVAFGGESARALPREVAALDAAAAPLSDDAAVRLLLFLDGTPIASVALPPERLREQPAVRAFGHVFCRWIRDGSFEPGFDLTDFLSLPPGVKYERQVSRALETGQIVSYGLTGALVSSTRSVLPPKILTTSPSE
jgi:hypothetical protein